MIRGERYAPLQSTVPDIVDTHAKIAVEVKAWGDTSLVNLGYLKEDVVRQYRQRVAQMPKDFEHYIVFDLRQRTPRKARDVLRDLEKVLDQAYHQVTTIHVDGPLKLKYHKHYVLVEGPTKPGRLLTFDEFLSEASPLEKAEIRKREEEIARSQSLKGLR